MTYIYTDDEGKVSVVGLSIADMRGMVKDMNSACGKGRVEGNVMTTVTFHGGHGDYIYEYVKEPVTVFENVSTAGKVTGTYFERKDAELCQFKGDTTREVRNANDVQIRMAR